MVPLIQSLLRPEAYDHPVAAFEVMETHISWVILTGEFAYKLKKPVNFGFVNFTNLELRKSFCEEELRLNRRLAADLYLDLKPVFGPVEQASFVGMGPPIEYAVKMRQFSQEALLPNVLANGELHPEHLDQFADSLAVFHDQAAVATASQPFGEPPAVRSPVVDNLDSLANLAAHAASIAELRDWSDREFARLEKTFQFRKRDGRVRECHGDLHLGNLVLRNNRIEAFDCLEFNAGLRWIDVISEVAFLVMDLGERGQPALAWRVLNRWLEQTGDYRGLEVWRWYFVYRALVRAKVAAIRLSQTDERVAERDQCRTQIEQYLHEAATWTQPRPIALAIMHGVSGSGKSFLAQQICERTGGIRVRTDVERKRRFGLWGIPRTNRQSGDLYAPEVTSSLYGSVLPDIVEPIVRNGFTAIVDGAFLHQNQRRQFRELAERCGIPFVILDVPVDPQLARERILQRQSAGGDPSDADLAVLEHQLRTQEQLTAREQSEVASGSTVDAIFEDFQRRIVR